MVPTHLLECVPNVSEGRDEAVIARIAERANAIPGAGVLHVDSNVDANRTVYTLAGHPDALVKAMMELAAAAVELIDMRTHTGVHNRLGALDVAPFVPLGGMTLQEAMPFAKEFGERLFSELKVPVYWYEACATTPARRALPKVRGRGYASLEQRYREQRLLPDLDLGTVPYATGASIVGAREILVAYNINLATSNVAIAKEIAKQIRSSGWREKGENKEVRHPRCLGALRAIGWAMPGYGNAQVSMNLLDYRETGLYETFLTCAELAKEFGTSVKGSELIGMLPEAALRAVAEALEIDAAHEQIPAAVQFLGLNSLREFKQAERILEYRIASMAGSLSL